MKVAQELKDAHIPRQIRFTDASKHAQVRLEQGEQALCPVLMHVTPCVFLLRMIDELVHVALHRSIATRGVRIESAPRLDREVGRFLHCLDGKVPRRLHHDTSLAANPRDDGRPILVVMAPPGLAFLAATPGLASQRLLAARLGLGEQGDAGGYAAAGISSISMSMSGYQRLKMAPSSPLSVFTRVCSNTCAPSLDHCICCFLQNRLPTTSFTVDSTNPVAIASPL